MNKTEEIVNKKVLEKKELVMIIIFVSLFSFGFASAWNYFYNEYSNNKQAEILDIKMIQNWSIKYKNVPEINLAIKEVVEDSIITEKEYYKVLNKVVKYKRAKEEHLINRKDLIKQIKINTKS